VLGWVPGDVVVMNAKMHPSPADFAPKDAIAHWAVFLTTPTSSLQMRTQIYFPIGAAGVVVDSAWSQIDRYQPLEQHALFERVLCHLAANPLFMLVEVELGEREALVNPLLGQGRGLLLGGGEFGLADGRYS